MHNNTNRLIILSLDLASEKYRQFPTPYVRNGRTYLLLDVLRGCLCFCVNYWKSWTLFYSTEHEIMPWWLGYCKPLVFTKNGEMVLLKKDYLVWLDLEGKNGNRVEIGGLPLTFEEIICIGSLSLLDGDPVIVGRQR
ncbi:unnamed protein product [Malus baccata var. baccata]